MDGESVGCRKNAGVFNRIQKRYGPAKLAHKTGVFHVNKINNKSFSPI